MNFYKHIAVLFLILTQILACTETISSKNTIDNWADSIKLEKATDINSQANIVEINLQAVEKDIELNPELQPGVFTKMWTYNGIFPGPSIEANVGDTLIVNFTNNLPVETTVHWHGLELPANMDGSFTAQFPVAANGGTFRYEFKLNRAATYWYHPHLQSNIQIEKGLYGALIVHDPVEDIAFSLPSTETTLILDDILLDEFQQIVPAHEEMDFVESIEKAKTQLNGREGNAFLVNGKLLPHNSLGGDLRTIKVRSGHPVRLRLINAANARFFRLSIPEHTIYKIGGDGGLLSTPVAAEPIGLFVTDPLANKPTLNSSALNKTILNQPVLNKINPRDGAPLDFYSDPDLNKGIMIVPGERADIIFTPQGNVGDKGSIEWHFFPRGFHGVAVDETTSELVINHDHTPALTIPIRLLNFEFVEDNEPTHITYSPPVSLKPTTPIITSNVTPVLPIVFGHSNPGVDGNVTFFASASKQPFSLLDDNDAQLNAIVGETYIWEVTNLTQGDHPFHPHGFTFQHISTEYIDNNVVENNRTEYPDIIETKDTIRIPARPGLKGQSQTIVRLAVKFEDANREGLVAASGKSPKYLNDIAGNTVVPGGWFVHCHILEHASRGMGTYLNLSYPVAVTQ